VLEYLTRMAGNEMTKMAWSWSRASMATMMLATAALSDPAFAKAQNGDGFNPHKHLAQNVTTASRPGVAGMAVATPGTAASELVRVLRATEGSSAALPVTLDEFERLPALPKRRVLTTHSAVNGAGEQGGSENVNGERS
jgi:hypothetical protein